MPQDYEIIISDTSCLILLDKINAWNLLKAFNKPVFITPIIKNEFGKKLPPWIAIKSPKNLDIQKVLEVDLDKGEASALALWNLHLYYY